MNSIPPEVLGGGEKWMVNAAAGLREKGHRVVIASKRGSELLRAAGEKGLPTETITIRGEFGPLNTWKILRFLRRESIDILVCNLNKDVRVAGLAARLSGRTAVVARHGVLLSRKKLRHRLTLTILTDGIITNARCIKETYDAYGWFEPRHVRVIYNGVRDIPPGPVHDFAGEFPGRKIVFGAGRLTPQKGFRYLVEAASILFRERRDMAFVVAGRGEERTVLEHLVEAHSLERDFAFVGHVEDVFPLMRGCDVFVLPSLSEGMPNALMEAMALGRPVLATAVDGTVELVEDGRSGLLVPPADPRALAEGIRRLLDRPERARSMAGAAGERIRSHFTFAAMIDGLEEYFRELLEERGR
jgi:glycosyltransferase involved in cell wall biosynthesis